MKTCILRLLCPEWGFATCEVYYEVRGVHDAIPYMPKAIRRTDRDGVAEEYKSIAGVLSLNGGEAVVGNLIMEKVLGANARREPGCTEESAAPKNPFKKKKPVPSAKPQSTERELL